MGELTLQNHCLHSSVLNPPVVGRPGDRIPNAVGAEDVENASSTTHDVRYLSVSSLLIYPALRRISAWGADCE